MAEDVVGCGLWILDAGVIVVGCVCVLELCDDLVLMRWWACGLGIPVCV